MKYYFITYFGILKYSQSSKRYWGDVTNKSPMQFITDKNRDVDGDYKQFVILNIHEISMEQYVEWEGHIF